MTNTITRTTPYDELPEFLTPAECRAYLGIGRSTVYKLLREGKIPNKKYGGIYRIPKTTVRPEP